MKTVIREFYENTDLPQELKTRLMLFYFIYDDINTMTTFSLPVRRANSRYSADMISKLICLHIEIKKRQSACKQWK